MPDQQNLAVYLLLGLCGVVGTVAMWFGKTILLPMRDAHLDLVKCLKEWLMESGKDIKGISASVVAMKESHDTLVESHEDLKAKIKCPEVLPRGARSHTA